VAFRVKAVAAGLLAVLLALAAFALLTRDDDGDRTTCASDEYLRHGVAYIRDSDQGCQFVHPTGEPLIRRCVDWQDVAPVLAELRQGCGEPGDFIVEFETRRCTDGRTLYFSPLLGGSSYVGDPLGTMTSDDIERRDIIDEALSACGVRA
jgi:hypothetical protein